jgi:hypothetical protein
MDFPTIAAALAASTAGDVVGVCGGTWTEAVDLRDGVHLVGMGGGLTRLEWPLGNPSSALLRARGVADSTVVVGFTLDGLGAAPSVVAAESTSTGLRLRSNVIRGGFEAGVRNGPDSFVRIGGALAFANDIFGNGAVIPRSVWNENVTADSLDALLNYWGTQAYDVILDSIEGAVRTCPITEVTHTLSLCAPPSALSVPESSGAGLELAVGPSPFRGETAVTFAPGSHDAVGRVRVYDVRGRHVVTLFDGRLARGPTRTVWTGRDQDGRAVAPGVYFVRLEAGEARLVRKVVRLR